MDEDKYKEELAKAGVELPEEATDAKADEAEAKVEEKSDAEDTKTEPLKDTPKEQRKRSIYEVYKEEKSDRKLAEERASKAEQERDELKRQIEDAQAAKGTDDAADTAKDAIEYAKKVGADPDLVKRIIEDARKGFEQKPDEGLMKDLADFKQWKTLNSKTIEASMFNEEFDKTLPSLKKLWPTVSTDELSAIKTELDKLSHTKEWHDKSLGYIAFENQDTLSALVSPKKRGMESKGRKDVEETSFDFDPNADLSSMRPKERAAWEKQYRELSKSDGLMKDAQGRRTLV